MASMELVTRMVTPQSSWPDKEEFLDVIYWGRQVGLVLGLGILLVLGWGWGWC